LVAARLFRKRKDHGLAVPDARDALLEKAQLGRVEGVIGEVEGAKRRSFASVFDRRSAM